MYCSFLNYEYTANLNLLNFSYSTEAQLHRTEYIYFLKNCIITLSFTTFIFMIFSYCFCFKFLNRIIDPAIIKTQPIPTKTTFIDFVDAGNMSIIVKQTNKIPITDNIIPIEKLFKSMPSYLCTHSILQHYCIKENSIPYSIVRKY